jgi:hypothetical protein
MGELQGTSSVSLNALGFLFILFISSLIQRVLYNLYWHPLAHIPGPRFAGATYLYQTYFGLSGGKSRYYIRVADLHQKYGTIKTPSTNRRCVFISS